jgi:uncharacterized protein
MVDVGRIIREDRALNAILAHVSERTGGDVAHDIYHTLRVAEWTIRVGGSAVDSRLAVAAALLHDVVNVPKDHPDRALASERSADVARSLLTKIGFEPPEIELVADAIRDHSFTRGATPASALGKALQDADRLEALGVIGAFRCVATGTMMGAAFFDPDDPWAERRALDDRRYSVDHFFVKLLKLPDTFQTDVGRQEAVRRADVMRGMLSELGRELGVSTFSGD